MFKKVIVTLLVLVTLIPALAFAGGQGDKGAKAKVTFYWALYDGLTEDYRANVQNSFNKAYEKEGITVDIVPTPWDNMHDKLATAVAGGTPPELSVVGTRWILEYMSVDAVEPVDKYVSKATLDNILPGTKEAVVNGKLMGLPIAAGARILAINTDLTSKVPATVEEMREEAIKVTKPGVYGLLMPGKKNTELTDFAYYLYAAGGDFYEKKSDGSFGKSAINSPAGVKALQFMVDIATKDKIVQEGYLAQTRMESHPIFYAGKGAYVLMGAWCDSAMKQAGSTFKVKYAQIPPFAGSKSTPLVITDSVAIFSKAKYKAEAGKFLDFFYKDEYKAKFDELVGFPPVTASAAKLPQFNNPLYQALNEAAANAKGWPLIDGFAEHSDIIWDACQKAFLGQMTAKDALDEAAAKINKSMGL
jgi:multiple sugar transport system substrate-binding protein